MTAPKLLQTTAFRAAMAYLVLFAVSVLAVFGFVWWQTAGFVERQNDETIAAEIQGLYERYRIGGVPGLAQVVAERSRNSRLGLYLLVTPNGAPVAGNLAEWPKTPPGYVGFIDFQYERPIVDGTEDSLAVRAARGRLIALPGGFRLLVARDVQERRNFEERVKEAMAWSVMLIAALGLFGGFVVSRNMLRRVDAITRASREIMDGDLGRRLPVGRSGDELDRLSESVNTMLDQIEQLMAAMRQVADNVAHDLRTPLNRLRARLEVTLMEPGSVPAYREAIERTIEEAERIVATFNAILGLARLESGAFREATVRVELPAVLADVAELYEPLAEDKSIRLSCLAPAGLAVQGNVRLIAQAVGNLVDNAVKYTPAGGAVTIEAWGASEGVRIAVSDTGPGIPEAERERAMDRFVRLDGSRQSPGAGLGLALARAVAHVHGGRLVLEDAAPGLRAVLTLPRVV